MLNEDNKGYFKYTGPQRFDKAIHTLEGFIEGVAIDAKVTDQELAALTGWIGAHQEFIDRHPFNEVIPRLRQILEDRIIDDEEKADILWLCNKITTENNFFSRATADMQRLQGILGGIVADNTITKAELSALQDWMTRHDHLRTCWPYDELEGVIAAVLSDGIIDEEEHRALVQFFNEFTDYCDHKSLELPEEAESSLISGVCSVCPEIVFAGRKFCFTGSSDRYKDFEREILQRGGVFSKSVTKDADYLTIGADGNPCWAYSCYGRKVEQAIGYRKAGARILLIHEYDLWDALEDSL